MTDDGIGGMTGQPDQGFAPGDGVWHPGGSGTPGGEYDTDATGFMPLAPPRPGADPLAAPGHGYAPLPLGGLSETAGMAPATATGWQEEGGPAAVPGAAGPAAGQQPARAPDGAAGHWTIPFVAEDTAEESGEYSVSLPAAVPARGPLPVADGPGPVADAPADEPGEDPYSEHPTASYVLRVNGVDRPVTDAWLGESLLYVLRERLGLAGAKDGCEQGECGACSVQVDGRLIASCLTPAATVAGCEIRTVEGLGRDGGLSDVQRALAASGAVQCGFCLPGLAMTIHDLLEGIHKPSELEMRQALSGNLCRCSGYRGVLDAIGEVVAARENAALAAAGAGGGRGASGDGERPDAEAARIPRQGTPADGPGVNGVGRVDGEGNEEAL